MSSLASTKAVLLGSLLTASLLCASGCHGEDTAPTNTKNSQYIDNGQTAADKIGADRAAAHRPRLPGKGVGNGQ